MNSMNIFKLEKILEAITMKLEPEFYADISEGITGTQFIVMKLLHAEDRTVANLSEYLGVTPEAVTSIVERMYHAGLVVGTKDEGDISVVKFGLTDKGVMTYKKCWEKRDDLINKYFLLLDEADQEKLIEILSKILRIDTLKSLQAATGQGVSA